MKAEAYGGLPLGSEPAFFWRIDIGHTFHLHSWQMENIYIDHYVAMCDAVTEAASKT